MQAWGGFYDLGDCDLGCSHLFTNQSSDERGDCFGEILNPMEPTEAHLHLGNPDGRAGLPETRNCKGAADDRPLGAKMGVHTETDRKTGEQCFRAAAPSLSASHLQHLTWRFATQISALSPNPHPVIRSMVVIDIQSQQCDLPTVPTSPLTSSKCLTFLR